MERKNEVGNQTITRVWEDSRFCLETSGKNAIQEFHLGSVFDCEFISFLFSHSKLFVLFLLILRFLLVLSPSLVVAIQYSVSSVYAFKPQSYLPVPSFCPFSIMIYIQYNVGIRSFGHILVHNHAIYCGFISCIPGVSPK